MAREDIKLSSCENIPVGENGKIKFDDTYIYTYSNTDYGATYKRTNYKLPLNSLRSDIEAYIGIENSKPPFTDSIIMWWGWWNDDKAKTSYIYEWDESQSLNSDYIEDKFGLNDEYNGERNVFILRSAPLPGDELIDVYPDTEQGRLKNLQERGIDPNNLTLKLVNKEYIDKRFQGFRKIYCNDPIYSSYWDSELQRLNIRPYTCFYIFDEMIKNGVVRATNEDPVEVQPVIDIVDDDLKLYNEIYSNKLTIFIQVKDPDDYYKNHPIDFRINGSSSNVSWNYLNEQTVFYHKILKDNQGYYTIRIDLEIVKDELSSKGWKMVGHAYTNTYDENYYTNLIYISQENCVDLNLEDYDFKTNFITDFVGVESRFDLDGNDIPYEISYIVPPAPKTEDSTIEYKWTHYIQTGSSVPPIKWGSDAREELMWSMEDSYAFQPILKPNKLYCVELTKVLDEVDDGSSKLLARIKYFVNLVRPPMVKFNISIAEDNTLIDFENYFQDKVNGADAFYNCIIDWGDGSQKSVYYNGMNKPKHRYNRGSYMIIIKGKCDGFVGTDSTVFF